MRGSTRGDLKISLATRGNKMNPESNKKTAEGSNKGDLSETKPGETPTENLQNTAESSKNEDSESMDTDVDGFQKAKRRNRSGAQKKRAKAARKDKAPQGSAGPSGLPATGPKRARESGETPPSDRQTTKKPRPTYSQAAKASLRVAIAGNNFPELRLSDAFANNLQEALERAIDALPAEGSVPRFDEYRLNEQGIIMVTCVDQTSKDWLTAMIGTMSPFQGTSVRILEGEAIPKLRKIVAFVPGAPVDGGNILQRIKRSTPELHTEHWKIRSIVPVPNKGSRIVLGVDEKSSEALKKLNFVGHVGMVRVSFWDPRKNVGESGASVEPGASGSDEADTSDEAEAPAAAEVTEEKQA